MIRCAPGAGGFFSEGRAGARNFREARLKISVCDARKIIEIAKIGTIQMAGRRIKIARHPKIDEQERATLPAARHLTQRMCVQQSTLNGGTAHNDIMGVGLAEGVRQ